MSKLVEYLLLVFPLGSAGLGVWQLRRLEWKKNLIAELESRLKSQPLDLMAIDSINDLTELEYRPFKIKGCFDTNPKNQIFLKPRILVSTREASMRGRSQYQRNIGVNVITPFLVENTDLRILINRGWLPLKGPENYEECADKGLGKANENREIIAILRSSDKTNKFGMKNDPSTEQWTIRNVEEMSSHLKTAPIYLELVENNPPGEYGTPFSGQTLVKVRNEHLNYAITWFGLSVFSFFMWYSVLRKKKPIIGATGKPI